LTKPLGTGIIATALKGQLASEAVVTRMTESMTALNKRPSELMQEVGANACTDITGFGLMGHALEMARASGMGIVIHAARVPLLEEASSYAAMGLVPAGTRANRDYASCEVDIEADLSPIFLDILYDPQTSGGLLISLPPKKAQNLVERLHSQGCAAAAIIGEVVEEPRGRVIVRE